MSIYSNVTEQELIILHKLAQQQKTRRALEFENRIFKQPHDTKLAESLSPNTKKLDETAKKTNEVIKEPNSEDDIKCKIKALLNSSKFSISMREMIGSLQNTRSSLKITQDESVRANILDVPIQISEADTIKLKENIYDLTPEIYKALSSLLYTGKTLRNEDDNLTMYKNIRTLGYTGVGDKKSNRRTIFTITLPQLVDDFPNKTIEEITDGSDDLQGEGVKIINPSNIIDVYTRLEILLGLKLSGYTDTPTEASNFIDELYEKCEIQIEQHYQNPLDKFST